MSLAWISRDGRLLIATQAERSLAYGLMAVLLGVYLGKLGFSLTRIGWFFTAGVGGSAVIATLMAVGGERFGRRRAMIALSLVTVTAALVLVATQSYWLLLLASIVGMLAGAGGSLGSATQAIETASLADTAPARRRTDI